MRRTALKTIVGLTALLLGLAGCATNPPADTRSLLDLSLRDMGTLTGPWRFFRADVPEAKAVDFDDAAWESVKLPHTWNAFDGSDGGNNYYRGAAWYRRTVNVCAPDLRAKRRFYLRFGGACLVTDVYVNGSHVGQHRGGYAAFCFDVTDHVREGKNTLAVRVDNARQSEVAPQSGDFTQFGGLYRDVALFALDSPHISPIDDAGPGVYVRQRDVSAESATIDVTTKLRNPGNADRPNASVRVELYERDRCLGPAARVETPAAVPAGGEVDVVSRLTVDRPHLWNGVHDPYLYAVVVSVRDAAGKVTDLTVQPLGLRTIAIDPDKGLLLNGEPYAMHGVNAHQDAGPGKGYGGSRADYDQRYALMREMGVTTVRMAHYQHHDYEYALCDKNGILVWTEVPMVDGFGRPPGFVTNLKQQMRELVKQNYNHPSVFAWGLVNEVLAKDDDPNWRLVRDCHALAKQFDPDRLTTMAQNTPPKHKSLQISDVIATNRYTGWYDGDPDNYVTGGDKGGDGRSIDAYFAANPGRAIGISEYGAGGSVVQHELRPNRVDAGGPWHPEEYQSLFHERVWRQITQRPRLWGTYVWVMFDFASDRRGEGDHLGRNDKGLVTFDGKTRKDAFYFYQANWTAAPMVHVTSARYEPYPVGRSDVKVYSNCDEVELFHNGRSLGRRTGEYGVFIWPDVDFAPGRVTTLARGTKDGKTVEHAVVRTVSRAASTRTTPPRPATRPATTRAS